MDFSGIHTDLADLFERHSSRTVAFRPFARSDVFPLFVATRNPEFNRFLVWSPPDRLAQLAPQVDKLVRDHQQRRSLSYSIVEHETGAWRGFVILKGFRDGVEMSLYLHPLAWNTGIVMSVASAVIELLSTQDPTRPIYNRIKVDNRKVSRLNTSYGFDRIGEDQINHEDGHVIPLSVFQLYPHKRKAFQGLSPY
jgi:RimJ/RimL family protein N-acetyltransferase